jgi:hypothetical protein
MTACRSRDGRVVGVAWHADRKATARAGGESPITSSRSLESSPGPEEAVDAAFAVLRRGWPAVIDDAL